MIGLPGPAVRDEDVRLSRATRAGGLILYRRSFESPAQLVTLLTTLETRLGRRLLVATDHEGGRVIMLGEGVTIFPDNLAVAAAGDPRLASYQGRIEAQELRRLGIDLHLGPVLDVLTDRYSPNIGIRAYGNDPEVVAGFRGGPSPPPHAAGPPCRPTHLPPDGPPPPSPPPRPPAPDATRR